MPDHVGRILERQAQYLERQDGVRFLVRLPRVMTVLRAEPRLLVHMDDLEQEAIEALGRFVGEDERLTERAFECGAEIGRLAPDLIEAHHALSAQYAKAIGLVLIDDLRSRAPAFAFDIDLKRPYEQGRAGLALSTLGGVLESARQPDAQGAPQHPELEPIAIEVSNLLREWHAAFRRYCIASWTEPGVALFRLKWLESVIDEPPYVLEPGEEALAKWADYKFLRFLGSDEQLIQKAVFDPRGIDDPLDDSYEQKRFRELVDDLTNAFDHLQEELQRRLGTLRSRRALVERFKLRAELHDSERLRALAATPKRGETLLTQELSKFLFDAGLNPLSEATLGNLRADLLDIAGPTFYVEAKQYASRPKMVVVNAMKQVWDTAGRLTPPPYDVHEAFLVVFRRSGPRIELPDEVSAFGLTVHLVLVDVGAAAETGSRQKSAPVVVTAEELAPHTDED
jgi:hypothetical protein